MAIKSYKPTTPARRNMTVSAFEGIDKKAKPERSLTETLKKNSGRTALSWIDEYTMSDAVYYLQSTSLSIKEVSNKMGFPNPSFFGRYFRLHKGVSPLAFRKRCQAQSKAEPAE